MDSREAARDQCGDVRGSNAEIYAELGEILAGEKAVGSDRTTIFESVGLAIEDIAAAALVYEAASR